MSWCEENRVDYVLGLARNPRLVASIRREFVETRAEARQIKAPARRFKDFSWATRDSWRRERRVIAKAEWTSGKANPRFVVTSLKKRDASARFLYEKLYCARGDMENRIKECQIDMFAVHARRDNAHEPAAALVRVDGLRADVCGAAHRARRHAARASDLRHDPPEASQDRRAGDRLGAACEARARLRLSLSRRLLHRRPSSPKRHAASPPSCMRRPRAAHLTRPPTTEQQNPVRPSRHHRQRPRTAAARLARKPCSPNRSAPTLREKAGLARPSLPVTGRREVAHSFDRDEQTHDCHLELARGARGTWRHCQ